MMLQEATRLVGPFEIEPKPEKGPGLIVVKGVLRHADLGIAAAFDGIAGARQANLGEVIRAEREQSVIEVVQLVPHARRQHRAQRPGVFARTSY